MTERKTPYITTDIIIEYNGGIVLIDRKNPPYGKAIPGGFQEYGLTLEENAVKEAKEETGLDVKIENTGHPFTYSRPDRDPRGHMITAVFYGAGTGELKASDDAAGAGVYSVDEILDFVKKNMLAFDHGQILKDYLERRGYI